MKLGIFRLVFSLIFIASVLCGLFYFLAQSRFAKSNIPKKALSSLKDIPGGKGAEGPSAAQETISLGFITGGFA